MPKVSDCWLLALAVGLIALGVGWLIGKRSGKVEGIEEEALRRDRIFQSAAEIVFGGHLQLVWDCLLGRLSKDDMLERLRESQKQKDKDKKDLARYRATYGPFDDKAV